MASVSAYYAIGMMPFKKLKGALESSRVAEIMKGGTEDA